MYISFIVKGGAIITDTNDTNDTNDTTVIAVIGGKLQGAEALYLANKAKMDTILIDKRENTPGRGLCNEFVLGDVSQPSQELLDKLKRAHIILPAFEDSEDLKIFRDIAVKNKMTVAFDFDSYDITSSKLHSNRLMAKLNIPMPEEAMFKHVSRKDNHVSKKDTTVSKKDTLEGIKYNQPPYIAKPSKASGSLGVTFLKDWQALEAFLVSKASLINEDWVIQSFLEGRQYSIEVIGFPGSYKTFEVTELHVDEHFDCKGVTAPCDPHDLPDHRKNELAEIAKTVAQGLGLYGIMDLEAIDHKGKWKVLEIDARMPSQTPTAVYHATGVNLLTELVTLYGIKQNKAVSKLQDELSTLKIEEDNEVRAEEIQKYTCYEHVNVKNGNIHFCGEHILSSCGPLNHYHNMLGADEILTDYANYKEVKEVKEIKEVKEVKEIKKIKEIKATIINSAESKDELAKKRNKTLKTIKEGFSI